MKTTLKGTLKDGRSYEIKRKECIKTIGPNDGAAPWKIGTKWVEKKYVLFINGENMGGLSPARTHEHVQDAVNVFGF